LPLYRSKQSGGRAFDLREMVLIRRKKAAAGSEAIAATARRRIIEAALMQPHGRNAARRHHGLSRNYAHKTGGDIGGHARNSPARGLCPAKP